MATRKRGKAADAPKKPLGSRGRSRDPSVYVALYMFDDGDLVW